MGGRTLDDTATDAELVRRARAGSDAAFGRLVRRHQAVVRGFLRGVVSGGWAEADDVAQEAFLAAWSSLRTLKDPAGFKSWLLGVAWRRAQDGVRSRLRGAKREAAWLDTVDAPLGVSPEDRMSVVRALGDLPAPVRACVNLCLAQDWSHSEAAEVLGLPIGTVKSHVARGRTRLLEALGGHDER